MDNSACAIKQRDAYMIYKWILCNASVFIPLLQI